MKIELIHAPGCRHCAADAAKLKAAATETVPVLDWREINVLDDLDYAVELGILTLPAIAIDGELAFSSLPTPGQLRNTLMRRTRRKS